MSLSIYNEATKDFIREHLNDDTDKLLLRKNVSRDVDVKFAVQQIEGRRKAQEKLPTLAANPDFIFPPKLSMEQCSSEFTAQYKSLLFEGKKVADLTGGLGVDTYYISQQAVSVTYVERDANLFDIARHNFEALGAKNIAVSCDDGIHFLQNTSLHFDAIYLDPARRDGNKNRVVRLADCEPNVVEYLDFLLSKVDAVIVKASPMLDITQALRELQHVREVHVVAVKNECKELLFVCHKGNEQPMIRCVNMQSKSNSVGCHPEPVEGVLRGLLPTCFDKLSMTTREVFDFSLEEENTATAQFADAPKQYLYEPNVALLKAGAFKLPCVRYGVEKLHSDTHLYTSDSLIPNFPGRIFEVQSVFPLNEAELKAHLPEMQANIATRNFPISVADIRKKYKIKDGGDDYLFAVTLKNGEKRVVKTTKKCENI